MTFYMESFLQLVKGIKLHWPHTTFSFPNKGLDTKLSVFQSVFLGEGNTLQRNLILASHWLEVKIENHTLCQDNYFTAVQFSRVSFLSSDILSSQINLNQWVDVEFEKSCFEKNQLTRCSFSHFVLALSDFRESSISKSSWETCRFSSSRFLSTRFSHVKMKNCQFIHCDIQGLDLSHCEWKDCLFENVEIQWTRPLSHLNLANKTIRNCKSQEAFLAALE